MRDLARIELLGARCRCFEDSAACLGEGSEVMAYLCTGLDAPDGRNYTRAIWYDWNASV